MKKEENKNTSTPIGGETVEQAADLYYHSFDDTEYSNCPTIQDSFIAGANWQKSQQSSPLSGVEEMAESIISVEEMAHIEFPDCQSNIYTQDMERYNDGQRNLRNAYIIGYNAKPTPSIPGDLKAQFEKILADYDFEKSNLNMTDTYCHFMQAAYRLAKSESEAIIKALSENTESMGETNKQLAKRLLAIQNILDEFNDDSNTYDMLSKIRTILKPTKESLLASVGDGWISVESELPGGQMPVIVYTVNGYTQTAFFEDDSSSWVGIGNFRAPKVTHWMPLPNPPQQ